MSGTLLEIKNLKKIFKVGTSNVVAVDNISFDIEKYDSLAIVGESGSGKTTLANLILGVEKKTAGSIRYNGEEINFKQILNNHTPKDEIYIGELIIHNDSHDGKIGVEDIKRLQTKKISIFEDLLHLEVHNKRIELKDSKNFRVIYKDWSNV